MRFFLTISLLLKAWVFQSSTGILWKAEFLASTPAVGNPRSEVRPGLSAAIAKLWRGEKTEDLPAAIHDGDEKTYSVLTPEKEDSELGVGLEWESPAKVNGIEVHYGTLNGVAYEPLPDFQTVQYRDGNQWRILDSTVRIDYDQEGELAPYQGSGWVSWNYRFKPVEARGIRILLNKTTSRIP